MAHPLGKSPSALPQTQTSGDLEREMMGAQSLQLQTEIANTQPASQLMEVIEVESESTVKSPFHWLANSQDPPELRRLRKFMAKLPDPILKSPDTWSFLEYVVAAKRHPGVFQRVLTAVTKYDQSPYRKEQLCQKNNIWEIL